MNPPVEGAHLETVHQIFNVRVSTERCKRHRHWHGDAAKN